MAKNMNILKCAQTYFLQLCLRYATVSDQIWWRILHNLFLRWNFFRSAKNSTVQQFEQKPQWEKPICGLQSKGLIIPSSGGTWIHLLALLPLLLLLPLPVNLSKRSSAARSGVKCQTGRSSSTTTASPASPPLRHPRWSAQTGCRDQTAPSCPPWERGGLQYQAPREPVEKRGNKKNKKGERSCTGAHLKQCAEGQHLLQDKVHASGLVHAVRQVNSLADLGVTLGGGCHDVSARVQQPPVVSILSWQKKKIFGLHYNTTPDVSVIQYSAYLWWHLSWCL